MCKYSLLCIICLLLFKRDLVNVTVWQRVPNFINEILAQPEVTLVNIRCQYIVSELLNFNSNSSVVRNRFFFAGDPHIVFGREVERTFRSPSLQFLNVFHGVNSYNLSQIQIHRRLSSCGPEGNVTCSL